MSPGSPVRDRRQGCDGRSLHVPAVRRLFFALAWGWMEVTGIREPRCPFSPSPPLLVPGRWFKRGRMPGLARFRRPLNDVIAVPAGSTMPTTTAGSTLRYGSVCRGARRLRAGDRLGQTRAHLLPRERFGALGSADAALALDHALSSILRCRGEKRQPAFAHARRPVRSHLGS
jgi:hypothetical protein